MVRRTGQPLGYGFDWAVWAGHKPKGTPPWSVAILAQAKPDLIEASRSNRGRWLDRCLQYLLCLPGAVKNDGSAQCWVDAEHGGDCCRHASTGITDVSSTVNAVMALNRNAGTPQAPRRVQQRSFTGTTDLFSTGYVFMALDTNAGTVRVHSCVRGSLAGSREPL